MQAEIFDQPTAALLADLKQRRLTDVHGHVIKEMLA
jgi:hypothetical protein